MLEGIALNRARKNSDTLMMFLLRAHKPQKYRERFDFNLKNDPEFKRTVNAFAECCKPLFRRNFYRARLPGSFSSPEPSSLPRLILELPMAIRPDTRGAIQV